MSSYWYDERAIGMRIAILFDADEWYEGTVRKFDAGKQEHYIVYDDGDKKWHNLAEDEKNQFLEWLDRAPPKVGSPSTIASDDGLADDQDSKNVTPTTRFTPPRHQPARRRVLLGSSDDEDDDEVVVQEDAQTRPLLGRRLRSRPVR